MPRDVAFLQKTFHQFHPAVIVQGTGEALFDDIAGCADDNRGGDIHGLQEVQLITVVQNGVGDTPALQNGAHFIVGIRGGENADDLNAFLGVFLTDFLEGRQLIDARAAPRLPEIQNGQSLVNIA